MPADTSLYTIKRPEQLAAIASAVRLEVLDAFRVLGPCSIATVAAFLGRAPDSLYYHIRKLVKVDLLVDKGQRPTGQRYEAVYDAPARRLRTPFSPQDTTHNTAVQRVYEKLLGLTERDFRAAVRRGDLRSVGPGRNVRHGRIKGWLSRSELQRVQALLDELLGVLEANEDDDEERELFALTTFLIPVRPKKSGSASGSKGRTRRKPAR